MIPFKFYDRLIIIVAVFFVMFVATSFLASLVGHILPPDSRTSLLTCSVIQCVLAFIVPALISSKIAFGNVTEFLTLDNAPQFKSLMGVIIVYILALPALNQLILWNSNLSFPESMIGVEEVLRNMEDNAMIATSTMLGTKSIGGLLVNLLIVGVLTGFAEEIFFRGTIQRAGASRGSHHTSIWVTALIFSAVHFQFFGFAPRLLLGVWFGYLLFWTQSIYVSAFAHALNNSIVVLTWWLSARGISDIDFETLGVADAGFPIMAFSSAIATVAFLYFFKDTFFKSSKTQSGWLPKTSGQ